MSSTDEIYTRAEETGQRVVRFKLRQFRPPEFPIYNFPFWPGARITSAFEQHGIMLENDWNELVPRPGDQFIFLCYARRSL